MSEEIKKAGTELSDADLESVSGAGFEGDIVMAVREICTGCAQNGQDCQQKLIEYLRKGHLTVDPTTCPFSNMTKGA